MILSRFFGVDHKANKDINKAIVALNSGHYSIFLYYRSRLKRKYHIVIGKNVILGTNIKFPHPQNIVIGIGSRIGDDCIIYHDVTFGKKNDGYPVLGNNIVVYPGAKIIGGVSIGDNSVIGANAVVTKSIPPNSIVGGVPGKVIRKRNQGEVFK